jgi:hypothetical protein
MRHHAPPPLQHARSPTSISGQIKMLKKMSVNPKYYRWCECDHPEDSKKMRPDFIIGYGLFLCNFWFPRTPGLDAS